MQLHLVLGRTLGLAHGPRPRADSVLELAQVWSSSQHAEAVARFLRQLLEHIVVPSVETDWTMKVALLLVVPATVISSPAANLENVSGVIAVIVIEMGMITPPVGLNVFVVKSVAGDVPMATIFRGVLPFWFAMAACLLAIVTFPQIALLIPQAMFQ